MITTPLVSEDAGQAPALLMPPWCVGLLKARRVRLGAFEGPVFPDSHGGWRDRNNVLKAFRQVRGGSDFEWVKTHTYRKTVATMLDQSGASARMIVDQLGHSRVSMTRTSTLADRLLTREPRCTGGLEPGSATCL